MLNSFCLSDYITEFKINEYSLLYSECTKVKKELSISIQNYIDSVAPSNIINAEKYVDISFEYDLNLLLMLSQAHIESHFGTMGRAKRTHNIYNIGNTDDGLHTHMNSKDIHTSIYLYADLMKSRYLKNKSYETLLLNFVCSKGYRFASAEDYEYKVSNQISKIKYNTDINNKYEHLKTLKKCLEQLNNTKQDFMN